MKKTHELILLGGFGNQLFILFKAYILSLSNPNDTILLNYSPILLSSRKDRPLQVEQLILRDNIKLVNSRAAKIRYIFVVALFKFICKIHLIPSIKIDLFFYRIYYSYHQQFVQDNISEKILRILRPLFQSKKKKHISYTY